MSKKTARRNTRSWKAGWRNPPYLARVMSAALLAAAIALVLTLPAAAAETGAETHGILPIIFVHGGSGSAAQFESQAMRFASNGYPPELISAFEYDSSFKINTWEDIYNRLDAHIARVMAETGAPKVNILGHSLGTTVMHNYLAYPWRAAKVANYVNIDGRTAAAPPGGVRTLAIWAGMGTPGREIVGAINVTIPGQTHVQVATSAESFAEMYWFFTGEYPATTDVVPQPRGQVRVAGRAVYFPLNTGVEGATVQMWEVNPATGRRMRKKPDASCVVGTDGAWGPFKAKGGSSYEFVILREGFRPHHFYTEPLIRSDYLVRLNTSPPGGIGDLLDFSDRHANLVITRNKELWGDQGTNNDVLLVDGVNVVTPAGCSLTKRTIGMFVYDWHADGVSDLSAPIPFLHALPFLTGVDLVVPAADPPNRTISLVLFPRGGGGRTQVINVPAWASSKHAVSVMFNDFRQDANTWVEYVQASR